MSDESKPPKVLERHELDVEDKVTENPRRHTWEEFQTSGMLWLINTTLHMFGWVIVIATDDETGEFVDAYPARTSWRGFSPESNARGHKRVAEYMAKASTALVKEATDD